MRLGDVSLKVYVVCLDGVGAHGVGDVNRTVEGVLSASLVNVTRLDLEIVWPVIRLGEVVMNTSVTVISDWSAYREVVETGLGVIIVNAHGETVPVPFGYSKEDWVDKIAEAMAYRNVTWVHTAMYPFYFAWRQEGGDQELWGEDGFKRLMSHIGLPDASCPNDNELQFEFLTNGGEELRMHSWYDLGAATIVRKGRPLKASDFKNYTILSIWGYEDEYLTGAVIKFANASDAYDFGFYVHIGTNQTYNSDHVPSDSDFYRGYAGAAAAMWANAWYLSAKVAISEVEKAISKAESEGRTEGLDKAKQLLQEAITAIGKWLTTSNIKARDAKIKAENATKPSPTENYALPLTIFGVAIATTTTSMIIIWKRNSKKKANKTK